MIRNLIFVGLIVLLFVGIIFVSGCGSGNSTLTKNPSGEGNGTTVPALTNDQDNSSAEAEKSYVCPMKEHTQVFTDPDQKCPECGMALVELKDGMHGDDTMHDMNDMHDMNSGHHMDGNHNEHGNN